MPWSYSVVKERADVLLQGFHEVELRNDFGRSRELQPTDGDGELLASLEEARQQALDRARQEAEALLAAARAEQEKIRQQAYQEGWQQGRQEALQAAAADAEEIRKQARQVLHAAHEASTSLIQESEADLVELALAIAGRIVQTQISVAPATVVEIARAAVREACRSQHFTIFAPPGAVELLHQQVGQLLAEVDPQSKMQIIADPALSEGSCRVETEDVIVDATLDGQLENLRQVLAQAQEARRHNGNSL